MHMQRVVIRRIQKPSAKSAILTGQGLATKSRTKCLTRSPYSTRLLQLWQRRSISQLNPKFLLRDCSRTRFALQATISAISSGSYNLLAAAVDCRSVGMTASRFFFGSPRCGTKPIGIARRQTRDRHRLASPRRSIVLEVKESAPPGSPTVGDDLGVILAHGTLRYAHMLYLI